MSRAGAGDRRVRECEQRSGNDDEGHASGVGGDDLRVQLEDEMAALAPEWERTAAWPSGPASVRGREAGSDLWWWYHERCGGRVLRCERNNHIAIRLRLVPLRTTCAS